MSLHNHAPTVSPTSKPIPGRTKTSSADTLIQQPEQGQLAPKAPVKCTAFPHLHDNLNLLFPLEFAFSHLCLTIFTPGTEWPSAHSKGPIAPCQGTQAAYNHIIPPPPCISRISSWRRLSDRDRARNTLRQWTLCWKKGSILCPSGYALTVVELLHLWSGRSGRAQIQVLMLGIVIL